MQLQPFPDAPSTSCSRATFLKLNIEWPIVLVYLYDITGGSLSSMKSGKVDLTFLECTIELRLTLYYGM